MRGLGGVGLRLPVALLPAVPLGMYALRPELAFLSDVALVTPGHFDIYHLGYNQARFPVVVQIASVFGHYGISFLVASINGLLADVWFALRDGEWSVRRALRPRLLRTRPPSRGPSRGVLVERVSLSAGGITPFARSRGAFALLCVAATLGLWLGTWWRGPAARGAG